MKYADKMEASGIGLIDLMSMKPADLASKFNMRKSHIATFVDTTMSCGIQMPPDLELPPGPSGRRRSGTMSRTSEDRSSAPHNRAPSTIFRSDGASSIENSSAHESAPESSLESSLDSSSPRESSGNLGFEPPALLRPVDAKKPNAPKGTFGVAESSTSGGLFGFLKASSAGDVTKLATLEKISLRQLAPDHRNGVDPAAVKAAKKPTLPFKASALFAEKTTLFLCIRRPGYASLPFLCKSYQSLFSAAHSKL